MEKRLKIGLYFMASAVLLMPLAILFKNDSQNYALIVLVFTMLLELIGLIFVILSILKKRKPNVQNHD
ncbi:MAG: hypothetical protein K2P75_01650 [Sphingobacteriaceae bacterium]|jgi:hypothetical protein|nr:hypothetical protein [Sphingobacteriaceae bacterium]